MTIEKPLWLGPLPGQTEGPEYSAQADRQILSTLFTEGIGNVQAGELLVAPRAAGANMTVEVAAGVVYVTGDDVVRQGLYRTVVTSTESVTIGGAPAANSRIDLVVARIYDAQMVGGTKHGLYLEVVSGVAAASPVAPAVPLSAIPLAAVLVTAGTTSIQASAITDRRGQAGSNKLVVGDFETMTTAQRLALGGAELRVGRPVFDSTLGVLFIYTAGGWRPAAGTRVAIATSFVIPASASFVDPAVEQTYTVPLGMTFRAAHVQIKTPRGGAYGIVTPTLADSLGVGFYRQYTSNDSYKTFGNVGVTSGALLNETGVNGQNWSEFITSLQLVGNNLVIKSSRYFNQGSIPSTNVSVALFGEV